MRTRGIFTVVILLFTSFRSYSQDTIVKTNGEEIAAKVIKITPELVEYYKFNRTDGPLYSIYITDISIIKYPDGLQDVFSNTVNINQKERGDEIESDKLIDERDGKKYKTVKIGDQWWMAENLQYNTVGSDCYDNDTANCEECGQYYSFGEAIDACPKGWHLPSDDEWMKLEITVGMSSIEAQKKGWRGTYGGQSEKLAIGGDSGLELDFCGHHNSFSVFRLYDIEGFYWTSTAKNNKTAWIRHFKLRRSIDRDYFVKYYGAPVRCIKDTE